MPPVSQTKPFFEMMDSFLTELQETKSAAAPKTLTKKAIEGMGDTSHPSEKVDNNTEDAPLGFRAKENLADVDKDVPGLNVSNDDPVKADENDVMPNIGVDQSETGGDPKIETDSAKSKKENPETTHPSGDDVNHKYASWTIPQLIKKAEDGANTILAHIAHGHFGDQPAPVAQTKKAAAPATQTTQTATQTPNDSLDHPDWEKQAAAFIEQAMTDAAIDATLVGDYLTSYYQKRAAVQKRAVDEANEGEDHGSNVPPMPPGADPTGGAGPALPGGDPAGGGGDPMAALGAATADAPPMAPPGGDPTGGGAPGGGAPGGADKEQALSDLVHVLTTELGLTPELFAQLAQGGPQPEQGAKMASAALAYQRSGKYRFTEAKTAEQRRSRNMIKEYVREIAGLS